MPGKHLDRVRWSALSHAYGEATDTPGHLRALAGGSGPARAKALRALSLSIIHQGSHWPGCVEATPFLVELALSPKTQGRAALVEFLAYLATAHEHRAPFVLERLSRRSEDALWAGTYRIIERALPRLARLVREEEPRLRAATAMLLGFFPGFARRAVPLLLPLLADRRRHVAASAALSLALCHRSHGDGRVEPALRALLGRSAAGSLAALGAALALRWIDAATSERVIDELNRAVAGGRSERDFPFTEQVASLAFAELRRLAPGLGKGSLLAIVQGIDALAEERWGGSFDRRDMVYFLLEQCFAPVPAPRRGRLLEELNEFEREVIERVRNETVNWHEAGERLRERGFPYDQERLAVFLAGDLPRGAFRCDGEAFWWPAWRFVVEAHLRGLPVDEVAAQLDAALSVHELVALAGSLSGTLWDLGIEREPIDPYVAAALARRGRDLSDIEGGVHELLFWNATPDDPRWCHSQIVRRARFEVLFAGEAAHPAMLLALQFGASPSPRMVELLSTLSEAERTAILLRTAPLPGDGNRFGSRRLEEGSRWPRFHPAPWHYLGQSRAPEWVRRVIALIERLEPWEVPLRSVVEFLAGLPDDRWALVEQLEREEPQVSWVSPGQPFDPERARAEQRCAWIRRARRRRARALLSREELRVELRQWFRDGAWLGSHENAVILLYPCPLCAQVFRELGIHPLNIGPGARGGILAPADRGSAGSERKYVHVSHAWANVSVSADAAWTREDEDEAVSEAVRDALAARGGKGDPECVEIRALHRLARLIRGQAGSV